MLEAGNADRVAGPVEEDLPGGGVLHHPGEAPGAVDLQGLVELRREGAGLRDGGRGSERFDTVRAAGAPAASVPGTWCQAGADGAAVAGARGAEERRGDGQARGERERHDQQGLEQQREAPPQRPGHRVHARAGSFCVSCCCWSFSPEMSPLVPETRASRYILNSSRRHRHCFLWMSRVPRTP